MTFLFCSILNIISVSKGIHSQCFTLNFKHPITTHHVFVYYTHTHTIQFVKTTVSPKTFQPSCTYISCTHISTPNLPYCHSAMVLDKGISLENITDTRLSSANKVTEAWKNKVMYDIGRWKICTSSLYQFEKITVEVSQNEDNFTEFYRDQHLAILHKWETYSTTTYCYIPQDFSLMQCF